MSQAVEPKAIYLKEYSRPDYLIPQTDLLFRIFEDRTIVESRLAIKAAEPAANRPLILTGEKLKLLEIKIDGQALAAVAYEVTETNLTVFSVPAEFVLEVKVEIYPHENKALEGLYKSGTIFCTQNEPEGFRKITYFLDRSDVMTRFTTTIEADKKYPVLLSNGNLIGEGALPESRHFAKWQNPFPMPCYLFALVAGELGLVRDKFTTKSGRAIDLRFYVDKGNEFKCGHAVEALKKAMRWDEETFGLEYDLDIYMIVAVDAFNFGAMENKGLNIFNSQYILADPKTATDQNYEAVQSVVAHEYFHNWTGNRVTCRDWFQITLKEGLTVFREQEFTADMTSRSVKRVTDAKHVRDYQFPEDAGPNAHPIRPESYIEVNNFYTVTVYEKGAEVIRMIQTLIGRDLFRKGIAKYFELFDGQAVTTEDFVRAMALVSGHDMTQFKNWYSQAGTPVCRVKTRYDAAAKKLELTVEQEAPAIAQGKNYKPYYFPLKAGLLDSSGREIADKVLVISKPSETFSFPDVASKPVLSVLRNFSAPVKLITDESREDLLFLLAHDPDGFNRYNAGQRLAAAFLQESIREKGKEADRELIAAFGKVLADTSLDPAFSAEMLVMPSLVFLLSDMKTLDVDAAFLAREAFIKALASAHEEKLLGIYIKFHTGGPYSPDREATGRRSLKNLALRYLNYLGKAEYREIALEQFQKANNMTDEISALSVIVDFPGSEKEEALESFYRKWQKENLVMNKWFAVQAASKASDTTERIKKLEKNPAFDIKNPNKARSLFDVFSQNLIHFHGVSGAGYSLLAEKILEIDQFNPSVASKLAKAYKDFSRMDADRKTLMRAELEKILKAPKLSRDVYEIVSKTLS